LNWSNRILPRHGWINNMYTSFDGSFAIASRHDQTFSEHAAEHTTSVAWNC
jgi:hypothetical protein